MKFLSKIFTAIFAFLLFFPLLVLMSQLGDDGKLFADSVARGIDVVWFSFIYFTGLILMMIIHSIVFDKYEALKKPEEAEPTFLERLLKREKFNISEKEPEKEIPKYEVNGNIIYPRKWSE